MRDCTVMEWNAKTLSFWDWESLDVFNGKVSDTSTRMQPMDWGIEGDGGIDNGSVYSSRGGGCSGSDLGNGSSSKSSISVAVESSSKARIEVSEFNIKTDEGSPKDHLKRKELGAEDGETCSELVASAGAGEPMIGLKLGKRTYFEDVCAGSTMKTSSLSVASSSSANSIKKSRALYQNMQTPRCQVEGCNLDLTAAKHYHHKHRVCESHSKSPRVVVAGKERRFCQQCSRFHELAEFDEKKRSCRRRLSEHNARRRKPQTDTISYNSTRLPSSFYGGKQQMNIVLNSLPVIHARPAANTLWEGSSELKLAQAKGSWLRTTKTGGIDGQLHVPSDGLPTAIPTVCHDHVKQLPFKRTTAAVLNQGLEASMIDSNLNPSPDFQRALSLLSTNSWVSAHPERSSLNQFMHSGHTNMSQPAIQTVHQVLPFASSEHWQAELPLAEARVPPLALQSSGSQFQEFQLFKAPNASGFFDNSRMW